MSSARSVCRLLLPRARQPVRPTLSFVKAEDAELRKIMVTSIYKCFLSSHLCSSNRLSSAQWVLEMVRFASIDLLRSFQLRHNVSLHGWPVIYSPFSHWWAFSLFQTFTSMNSAEENILILQIQGGSGRGLLGPRTSVAVTGKETGRAASVL